MRVGPGRLLPVDQVVALWPADPAHVRTLHTDELMSQESLHADALLRRFAAENPNTEVRCLRFESLADPTVELWYPAVLQSPFASGVSHSEALLRALLKTVERDALSLGFVNATPGSVRTVEQESLPDEVQFLCRTVRQALGSAPLLIDITTDLGIPVFCALSSLPEMVKFGVHGSAASLSPAYAAERALLELLDDSQPSKNVFTHGEEMPLSATAQVDVVRDRLVDGGYEAFQLHWNSGDPAVNVVAACVPGLETFSVFPDDPLTAVAVAATPDPPRRPPS